ncbi:MAG: hypothetical protein MnENMB40S_38750 [Rhizobiaceae bacterium MnEN-MB40S]|nr:MAG: hypothetical protein MnENMB40S_38750 [Rhizobiaceae bacterium MnEN-MB40S]
MAEGMGENANSRNEARRIFQNERALKTSNERNPETKPNVGKRRKPRFPKQSQFAAAREKP